MKFISIAGKMKNKFKKLDITQKQCEYGDYFGEVKIK